MLLSQGRHELAEEELRRGLVQTPNDAISHAMLSVCLIEQKNFPEATEEAGQAIHLAPDEPFPHYVMGQVMYHRNRFDEARASAEQAVAFDPYDADYFALLSAIELESGDKRRALEAAEQGLEVEPDHVRCVNLRAMALTKLGRAKEASESIDVAIQNEPDNAYSHANKGWTLLYEGEPRKALEHFRESLRLEPDSEFARAGIVEAMKARNPIYRWLLTWFLYVSNLNPKVQIALILGLVFGQAILVSIISSVPLLAPFTPLITLAYIGLVWMSWCGSSLFNLVLRFDQFGRMALSPSESRQSSVVAIYLLVAAGLLVAAIVTKNLNYCFMAIPFALAMLPLNGVFSATTPTLKWLMIGVTAAATWFALQAAMLNSADALRTSIQISAYSTWASLLFIGTKGPKKI